jgi:hypothetical protein
MGSDNRTGFTLWQIEGKAADDEDGREEIDDGNRT